MKVVFLAVVIACAHAELRLTSLTGTQGATALPILARSDPCADNLFLQQYSSMPAPATCVLPRATDSQTTFYGPGLGSTGVNTAVTSTILLNFAGIGISALITNPVTISATLAPLGRDCSAVAGNAEAEARVSSFTTTGTNTITGSVLVDGTAAAWNGVSASNNFATDMELEEQPRDICFRLTDYTGQVPPLGAGNVVVNNANTQANNVWFYSGFRWKVQRYCTVNANCAQPYANTATTIALSPLQQAIYVGRSQCCGRICVNPNTHACCSSSTSRAVEKAVEKCCDVSRGLTAFINAPCECYSNTGATSATSPACPSEESECCLPAKFGELFPRDCNAPGAAGTLCGNIRGQCFNPKTHRCCSNGGRYDPGAQQCCKITGLQSLDTPCPCSADTDCQQDNKAQFLGNTQTYAYSQDGVSRQRCCIRSSPAAPAQTGCSQYVNYPAVQSTSLTATQCTGVCIDTRYQVCCNGVACRREYERCCNTTCCNRFTGTCTSGRKIASARHFANSREYKIPQDYCTTVEKLDEIRSFWIFILPAALLLATLGSLGFALVFANKAANRLFSFIEKLIIGISVAVILLGSLLFFSPAYKYGVFINVVALLAILTAAARVKWFNAFTTIALVVLLFYIINPFDGNNYLTFNYLRSTTNGEPDARSHGLFHLLTRMFARTPEEEANNLCVNWYQGYFRFDVNRYSPLETNLANPTFAYCSRGFLTGLLIVSSINLVLLVALFILSVFGLVLRFRKQYNVEAPVELTPFPLY